jgi:hypothetical protein
MEPRVQPAARLVIRPVVSYPSLHVMVVNLDGTRMHTQMPLRVAALILWLDLSAARALSGLIWLEVSLVVGLVDQPVSARRNTVGMGM